MKMQLRIALTGVMLMMLGACATFMSKPAAPLAGTWTNSLGAAWTLRADGTFDVDINHDGKRDIWGTYTVDKDTLTILHNEGKVPKGCGGPGIYKFKRTGKILSFTLVTDACKERRMNIVRSWHEQK